MDIVHKSNLISKLIGFVFSFFLLFTISLIAQDTNPANGKKLFNANCAACHKLDTKLLGPPLSGVEERRAKEWIYQFVQNSAEFMKKDAEAKAIFDEYKIPMTPFTQLSHKDIDDIIAYTTVGDAGITQPVDTVTEESKIITQTDAGLPATTSNWWWQPLVLLLMIGIIYFFAKKKLNLLAIFFTFIMLFSTAYFLFAWLMQIGVETGYKPIQPIEFSHKVHAGDNGIDCEYCHSSAKHSKTSGIPTSNVCMNCHKLITEYNGDLFGNYTKADLDAEIAKVHAAAGWEPSKFAYTGKGKGIEWTRVHNLPDFVYYNHSQHVSVAGLECQTCHGPVEEMHRVEQYSPLTMDWCVSCHRDTNVKMDENGYYMGTYKHLKDAHKGVTVADMGGKECGKCHY
jgi:cytochrome c2